MPEATLTRNDPGGDGLRVLTFGHAPEGYTRPGQFVTAAVNGLKPGYYALASSPGEPVTLLIKAMGELSEALCALEPGDAVEMSDAMGKGFDVSGEGELVVLCNGSAISACRPVIEAEVAGGLSRAVHLYFGVLKPEHRSFLADLERWANAGVKVHTVVGEPEGTGWSGAVGFVQDVAEAHGLCRADVEIVLCGVPPMVDAAKARWSAAGCERILTNY
ncbi:MAG: FAD-dependent oxidoreductase [Deltaproteobacteria bacterium]|nr:MAG: FAD-dependent oxidoreductase [Deltaproteobacteria bacterium]